MKFKMIVSLYLLYFIVNSANSANTNLRSSHQLRNSNLMADFKDSVNDNQPINPKLLEDVVYAKSTKIIAKSNDNTRFKESESLECKHLIKKVGKNMETPEIKNSSADSKFQDVVNRVSLDTMQTVTNNNAFDSIYKDHRDFYKDKKYVVFDSNFKRMENFLLGQFSNSINSQLTFDKTLLNVEDYKSLPDLNVDFSRVPNISKYNVGNSLQTKNYGSNVKDSFTMVSDPYNKIFN